MSSYTYFPKHTIHIHTMLDEMADEYPDIIYLWYVKVIDYHVHHTWLIFSVGTMTYFVLKIILYMVTKI